MEWHSSVGINVGTAEIEHASSIADLVAQYRAQNFDLVCLPLSKDAWRARWKEMCTSTGSKHDANELRAEVWRANPTFQRDEVNITRLEETGGVIGLASELELDSPDDWIRIDSEVALRQEVAYASYVNLQTVLLPPPRNRAHAASYGRAVNACLSNTTSGSYLHLSIRILVHDPYIYDLREPPESNRNSRALRSTTMKSPSGVEVDASWEIWDTIRTVCGYNSRLSLALELPSNLPSVNVLSRWEAEPVKYIFLPATNFIPNAKGYPVLPRAIQNFLRDMFKFHPTILLSGIEDNLHSNGGSRAYEQYVRHLEKTSPSVVLQNTEGTVENFAWGYNDYLQAPLQPLMDNLQSMTYDVFEKCPTKYQQYEQAIYLALMDRPPNIPITICVAGAGRGPLVVQSLQAIRRSRRNAHIYAVEKNANAYVSLSEREQVEWRGQVTVVFGDMRSTQLPEKVDILVSELLGSLGDNELSPECLDGSMRWLKDDGVSIPSSYTAHVAPISSHKLWNEANSNGSNQKSAETPYVVMLQAINTLSGDGGGLRGVCGPKVQECWMFEHPRKDVVTDHAGIPITNTHNTRSTSLKFHIPHAGILHGLAGYFEAVLYGNVGLSIHPDRKDRISPNMTSWFPLFFPLKEPLYLPANSELSVYIWRLTDPRKVWYEWFCESFIPVAEVRTAQTASSSQATLNGTTILQSSPVIAAPSPLMDAPLSAPWERKQEADTYPTPSEVVKIGQTTLHNPAGRSSWIGL